MWDEIELCGSDWLPTLFDWRFFQAFCSWLDIHSGKHCNATLYVNQVIIPLAPRKQYCAHYELPAIQSDSSAGHDQGFHYPFLSLHRRTNFGAQGRNRTADPLFTKEPLCLLSYSG
jgi:hypothetical protein